MKEVLSVKGVFERTRAREGDRSVSAREDKTATNTLLERKQKLLLFSLFYCWSAVDSGTGRAGVAQYLLHSPRSLVSRSCGKRLSPNPALPQPSCNDKKETTIQQKRPTIQQKRPTTKQKRPTKQPWGNDPRSSCCSSSRARQTPSCQQDRPATVLSLTSLTLTPLGLNFFLFI